MHVLYLCYDQSSFCLATYVICVNTSVFYVMLCNELLIVMTAILTRIFDNYSFFVLQMDKYQEQGQLLEPYLESIVSPLMFIIRSKTKELGVSSDEILEVIKPVCIIIYSLVTVCGYKAVIKFFPHQVSDLELAVSLLEKCHNTNAVTSLRHESTGEMEAKCVILLWLSILVLVPFDISSVDTSIANSKTLDELEPAPLVLRILAFSKDYLSNAGPMRTIAGLLLSRLLTRPDMPKAFTRFSHHASRTLHLVACYMTSGFSHNAPRNLHLVLVVLLKWTMRV